MADTATNPIPSEPAPPAALEPMSAREADSALESFFDSPKPDPVEPETGNPADIPQPNADDEQPNPEVEDEANRDDSDLEVPEDAENPETEEQPDAPYEKGRFAADDAKVKMADGSTISVAELKTQVDKRVADFQRDYTRSKQELSDERKEFETERAEFSQQTERHGKEREFFTWFTRNYVPQEPQKPTVDASVDPVAWSVYAQHKTAYDEMVNAWNQAQAVSQEETKAQTEKQQKEAQKALQAEHARFLEAFPSLKDKGKYEAFWGGLKTDANKFYGVPEDRVLALSDTTMVRILNDAVAYRRLKSNSANVKQQVTNAPKLVQSSTRSSPEQQQRRAFNDRVQKLRQSGSTADADAVLLSFIK